MNSPVLEVNGVGKCYRKYRSELQRFAGWFGVPVRPLTEHWVLRNISFSVLPGEAVGIVGQNGAGKSTLLKIITGTTQPSTGAVHARGRTAALLELGLGFNADLTGRENARHAAGLMGLAQESIPALLEEIERFAEIGDYFDQPLRTYSSGMQMRVAFSVATAVRPDTLIVDEALSVGDAYFIHKCFKRIREYREAGTTLLIVSHDAAAIQALCDRAILIDSGTVVRDGDPQMVMDYYNAIVADKENSSINVDERDGRVATQSGSGEARFIEAKLIDSRGDQVEFIPVGEQVTLRLRVQVTADIDRMIIGYLIKDRLGQHVFGTNTHHTGQGCERLSAGDEVVMDATFPMNLGPGTYSVSLALSSTETHLVRNYEWKDLALVFNVANTNHDTFVGTAWIRPEIRVQAGPGGDSNGSV